MSEQPHSETEATQTPIINGSRYDRPFWEDRPAIKMPDSEKIFDLRTPLGIPNTLLIEKARQLHERLAVYPGFIGLAINGSLTKGYSSSESDIDAHVLYDSSKLPSGQSDQDLYNAIRAENGRKNPSKLHRLNFHLMEVDLNPEVFYPIPDEVADIFRLVTGSKIKEYRQQWADKLAQMPIAERDEFINDMVEFLAQKDAKSWGWEKMVERMTGISRGNVFGSLEGIQREQWERSIRGIQHLNRLEYEGIREKLWRQRIESILAQPAAHESELIEVAA